MGLKIVMVSAEVETLARTGGLGDAVAALAVQLAHMGHDVLVVTPHYGTTRASVPRVPWSDGLVVGEGALAREVRVLELPRVERAGGGTLRTCLVSDPGLFDRAGIYGDTHGPFGDNDLRFSTLSRAALAIAARVFGDPRDGAGPDVVHAHDWHAAVTIVHAKALGPEWARVPTVLTLHNVSYQGVLDVSAVARLGLPEWVLSPEIGGHDGALNLVKAAIALADRVTTVSPSHAREILTPEGGFGLDAHLRAHASKVSGILNGIDELRFDPGLDGEIARKYDFASFVGGRRVCKAALLEELGLDADVSRPLFGLVSRLTWQKGIDLVLPLVDTLVERGARLAFLGTGERELEAGLLEAARRHPGRVAARITFDDGLARRMYAGLDFVLVPSRFEPCGLTQMYAMRYGAIPIVTPTGGLADSVSPVSVAHDTGTGIVAHGATVDDVLVACDDAFVLYGDEVGRRQVIERAMARDASWGVSARAYVELFRAIAH
ncbi:MAG: glycogen/starch synthase [Polyangiaceae bacterium]